VHVICKKNYTKFQTTPRGNGNHLTTPISLQHLRYPVAAPLALDLFASS